MNQTISLPSLTLARKFTLLSEFVAWHRRVGATLDRREGRQQRWTPWHPHIRGYSRLLRRPTPIVWIASVSKSGNTWVRYLLFNSLFGPVTAAGEPESAMPLARGLLDAVGQRMVRTTPSHGCLLVKTHARPEPSPTTAVGHYLPLTARAIYICRNPGDVCLAQINHMRLIGRYPRVSDRDLAHRFLEGRLFPPEGVWDEHVAAWRETTAFPVLVLRYEDLRAAPDGALARMLTFLGEPFTAEQVATAVRRSDLHAMRALEDAQGTGMGYRTPRGDPQRRFINDGAVGKSLTHLGADFIRAFDRRYGDAMEALGYERPVVAQPVSPVARC